MDRGIGGSENDNGEDFNARIGREGG